MANVLMALPRTNAAVMAQGSPEMIASKTSMNVMRIPANTIARVPTTLGDTCVHAWEITRGRTVIYKLMIVRQILVKMVRKVALKMTSFKISSEKERSRKKDFAVVLAYIQL